MKLNDYLTTLKEKGLITEAGLDSAITEIVTDMADDDFCHDDMDNILHKNGVYDDAFSYPLANFLANYGFYGCDEGKNNEEIKKDIISYLAEDWEG